MRSDSRAVMALDHSRIGVENKFLKNKSGRIFCVRQVYFTKSWQQIFYTLYITSEVKQYYEALYSSYKPRKECKISQLFKTNCTHSIFRTINRGLLRNRSKNFQNHPVHDQPVVTFDKRQICSSASGSRVFE